MRKLEPSKDGLVSRLHGPTRYKQTPAQVRCIRTVFEQESEAYFNLRNVPLCLARSTTHRYSICACTKRGRLVAGMQARPVIRPKPRVNKFAKVLTHGPSAQRQRRSPSRLLRLPPPHFHLPTQHLQPATHAELTTNTLRE